MVYKCVKIIPVISRAICNKYSKLCITQIENKKTCILSAYNLTRNVRHYSTDTAKIKESTSQNIKERVYYGILTPQIRTVKLFSLSTSIIGLVSQPFIYKELAATQSVSIIVVACSFVGFFTFVTPLLLHYITKKYVTHLDYKPESQSYVATTLNFFCRSKEIEFKIEDVKVPDIPGMFTTFEVKGVGLFLDPRLFEDPSHYAKIMGYDKPIDFKLYETSDQKTK